MDLTPICITGIIFFVLYRVIELFVLRKERLMIIDKLSVMPSMELTSDISQMLRLDRGDTSDKRFTALKWGSLFIGLGLGIIIGASINVFILSEYADIHHIWKIEAMFSTGCPLFFGGLGLLIAFYVEYKIHQHDRQ